jgi:hypothetical protein
MSAVKGTSANRNSSYFDWTSTESTQTRLIQARRNFLSALDERFGKGPSASPAPQMDWRTVLVSLVSLQLVNVQLTGPNQARLELKTTSKGPRDRLVRGLHVSGRKRTGPMEARYSCASSLAAANRRSPISGLPFLPRSLKSKNNFPGPRRGVPTYSVDGRHLRRSKVSSVLSSSN